MHGPFLVPAGAKGTDPAVATWRDGTKWPCPAVFCDGAAAILGSAHIPGKRGLPDVYWNGTVTEGRPLTVRKIFRKDQQWLQIWRNAEKPFQVSQCTDTEPDSVKWFVDRAREFAAGQITKNDIEAAKRLRCKQEKNKATTVPNTSTATDNTGATAVPKT